MTRRMIGEIAQWGGNCGSAVSESGKVFEFTRGHIRSIPHVFEAGLRVEIFADYDETGTLRSFVLRPVPRHGVDTLALKGQQMTMPAKKNQAAAQPVCRYCVVFGCCRVGCSLVLAGCQSKSRELAGFYFAAGNQFYFHSRHEPFVQIAQGLCAGLLFGGYCRPSHDGVCGSGGLADQKQIRQIDSS
ncbi:hypothetical protein GJV52_08430 [Neisseria brasiliensis]|uniref:hypothetical protein n=1 Tax=Neisseria brasiliensis TaxID=2666100 RepID=UPI0012AA6D80|nr:hypothetical protein [Neisseria brasiliensis]QGL25556.1 hypothetical protein GJV52_08430 [Neisseria brasiliensis]